MSNKRVTVAIVPRERFSHTEHTIRSVIDNTQIEHDLIFVDGKTPDDVMQRIETDLERAHAKVISSDAYVSPNEARNMAAKASETDYIVFLDNDTLVGPRWLDALVQCADETGATQAGPLQFIGDFKTQTIHIAGGILHEEVMDGKKILYDEQKLFEAKLKSISEPLRRSKCDYIEFHCMLLRQDFLEQLGGLDEQLKSVHEHIDLGLELRRNQKDVYFEPGSLVTYIPPREVSWFDLPYFEIRWSEEWTLLSAEHFRKKWKYDRLGYMGEESMDLTGDTIVRFVRGHRGSVAGLAISADNLGASQNPTRSEFELIVSGFLSVECRKFKLCRHQIHPELKPAMHDIVAEDLFKTFDADEKEFDRGNLVFGMCPVPGSRLRDPCLARLKRPIDCSDAALEKQAFMVLKTPENMYEYWFAVALNLEESVDAPVRFAQQIGCSISEAGEKMSVTLSGLNNNSHRLHLINTGRILTEKAFSQLCTGHPKESVSMLCGVLQ